MQSGGCYYNLDDVDPWDEARDARKYSGPWPVVAHPPCHLWVNLAAVNWKRYQKTRPAWYPEGSDTGCFSAALASVRRWGGVLEHPAGSHAWRKYHLREPTQWSSPQSRNFGWVLSDRGGDGGRGWVCEVWQSAYGHRARKKTWLYYVGSHKPAELDWSRQPGTHQVGWFDRAKPTLSKREASATPVAFREALLELAREAPR